MAEWKEWNEKGMQDCLNSEGFILRFEDGTESNIMSAYPQITSKKITHYWIIPWTKCSERMPPDDEAVCITKYPYGGYIKLTGEVIHDITKRSLSNIEWLPYDESNWERLKNDVD